MSEIIERLPVLSAGSHDNPDDGMCVMEAVAFVAGEPFSDRPACACPVISAFVRTWNDNLPDSERDALLRPLILQLIGTKSIAEVEQRRAVMAADWLIREHTPAWLRLAKLDAHADALASLPEITDFSRCPSLMPTLEAAMSDANAARDAARNAALAAAWDAALAAAWDAAWDAALAAAWDAALAAARAAALAAARSAGWDAAWDAARDAALAAALAAARAAARDAALAAARAALNETRLSLQQSALRLVERMIAVQS